MDDNEIKKRLAGRAAEYMMFKDDEEDTEAPADTSSAGNVIVFPNFEKLKSEVEKMRTELSMLLLERDELQFVICKNIETEYMLKLGSIEYKAYEAQCAALRLKRKIELIQAKKNRQEKVIISTIEETLDNEFAEYQKQLNEQIDKMNDALKRSKAEVLLPHFSCHSLRHTFTTRMCEAGVNVKVIQDTLGHKDISTTLNIYTDVTKELRTSEFEGLDSYFKNEYNKAN